MTINIKDFWSNFKSDSIQTPLYRDPTHGYIDRKTSSLGMEWSKDIAEAIETLTTDYMKYRKIEALPARIDFWLTKENKLVPFEINTWFVDQFGAWLNLAEATNDEYFNTSIRKLWEFRNRENIILTQPEYTREMNLMREYLQRVGVKTTIKNNTEEPTNEDIFCYGYPTEYMKNKRSFVPWGIGLGLESKKKFYTFMDQWNLYPDIFSSPTRYNKDTTPYSELPKDRELIFKKDGPKIKWDRLTVLIAKAKNKQERIALYESGEIIAQELIDTLISPAWWIIEARALLLPNNIQKYSMIIAYALLGDLPEKRGLVNDSNPQWPIIVI